MLNEIITIDLHIHSKASEYKENSECVKNSHINNIEVLIRKLEENHVNMFSITDHNRFDYALYSAFKLKLSTDSTIKHIKKILPGVEFDVQFETDKPACHVIVIFNDNDEDKIKIISDILLKKGLKTKSEFYQKFQLEEILKEIDLDVLLIAHQNSDLDKITKKSLSSSVTDTKKEIKIGYIDALEYKKSINQGILKNSLQKINTNIATITGSDCHTWSEYPNKNITDKTEYLTKIKCLPTFKGLVFSFTSIETRFNRNQGNHSNYIDSIEINSNKISLSSSINAIIGDNASGKSLLLNRINNSPIGEYKEILKLNDIKTKDNNNIKIEYMEQGKIMKDVREGKLFKDEGKYLEIETLGKFESDIRKFNEDLFKLIEKNINSNNDYEKLKTDILEIKEIFEHKNYNVNLISNITEENNIYIERLKKIKEINDLLLDEYKQYNTFYNSIFGEKINNLKNEIFEVYNILKNKSNEKERNKKIQNIITKIFKDKSIEIRRINTDKENEAITYKAQIENFKNSIIKCIKENTNKLNYPEFPDAKEGISTNSVDGYKYLRQSNFHNKNLKVDYYENMFTIKYNSEEEIKKIDSNEKIKEAIIGINKSATETEKIEKIEYNLSKFIKKYSEYKQYIQEENGNDKVGKTQGEISLITYKKKLEFEENYDVLLIDQPEDDISSKKIEDKLLKYINNIRDNKQIIMVTHNPILVANLDVDNVIYLKKDEEDKIKAISGCLEYEENKISIIDLVGENLDGGYDIIERRMKMYDKNYNKI